MGKAKKNNSGAFVKRPLSLRLIYLRRPQDPLISIFDLLSNFE